MAVRVMTEHSVTTTLKGDRIGLGIGDKIALTWPEGIHGPTWLVINGRKHCEVSDSHIQLLKRRSK